jgi:hypothetical protein
MWNIFRSKPKSEMQVFVEGALKLSGKRAVEVADATEIAAGMMGGLFPPLALAKHAEKLAAGPMSYKNADLGVATALFFFREEKYHDILQGTQLRARMTLLELVKAGRVNPLLASAFENSLYERYAPAKKSEYAACHLLRWPELITIFEECLGDVHSEKEFSDLLSDEGIDQMIIDEFNRAVAMLKTTPVALVLQHFVKRALGTLIETSKTCPEDLAYNQAVKETTFITLCLCLGVAPAVHLAAGVPTVASAGAMIAMMNEAEWDRPASVEYRVAGMELIWALHEKLAPLASAVEMPGNSSMKNMQAQLQTAFGTIGIDFMGLHPAVHRAVLLEAMNMGGAATALNSFKQILEASTHIQSSGLDPVAFIVKAHETKLKLYEG